MVVSFRILNRKVRKPTAVQTFSGDKINSCSHEVPKNSKVAVLAREVRDALRSRRPLAPNMALRLRLAPRALA